MPPTNRPTYHHGDLRDALIAAADTIIRENGIEGFALREAARRAGVSPGAPAHHFGGSVGLLTEVATRAYLDLKTDMDAVPDNRTPAQDVKAFASVYVGYALHHPGRFRLMCRKDLIDRTAPAFVEASMAAMMGFATAAAAYHGETLADDPAVFVPGTLATLAAAHGIAHMTIEDKWSFALDPAQPANDFMRRLLPAIVDAQWPDRALH